MPSSSPKVSDLVPSSLDAPPRQQRRAQKTKKPRVSTPTSDSPPRPHSPVAHETVEQDVALQDSDHDLEPAIYPRQIAKSPPFAFASLNQRTSKNAQPYTSPDLLAQHSPPGSLPRHYNDLSGPFSTFAARHNPPGPYSSSGSPPLYNHHDTWSVAPLAANSPPSNALLRSPQFATASPVLPHASMASRRQSSRDASADTRAQLMAAAAQLNNPPLPHQIQPHYYGLPDPDLGLLTSGRAGVKAGDRDFYCAFDTVQTSVESTAHNLVLVGSQGAIDVYKSERAELSRVGHLEGLRGAVVGAKVLTWPSRDDPFASMRPLVALVIHGPTVSSDAHDTNHDDPLETVADPAQVDFQTSVEVYSLASRTHVATLYTSETSKSLEPLQSSQFVAPPPIGDLRVDASSRFVIVASGASGEVFVFAPSADKPLKRMPPSRFRCVGKYWTSVERCFPREKPAPGPGEAYALSTATEKRVPVYALSGRWLVIAPPTSASPPSIKGNPLLAAPSDRPPGLNHFTAPGPPLVDCIVDSPDQESMLNRVTRVATQEMIKGAQWVGTQGMQAWRNYWSKPPQPLDFVTSNPAADAWFPPTHADLVDGLEDRSRPALVSIVDLEKLVGSLSGAKVLEPLGTFETPEGCSCVSLSPSGLSLLTVSHRGDIQRVWDLMRLRPTQLANADSAKSIKPMVRQVAKFQRLTDAHVVETVWSEPKGDKLAIVTHRGTVHLFEVPAAAFQWPPRVTAMKKPTPETGRPGSESGSMGPQSGFIPSTISSFNDTVRKQASGLSTLTSNLNITQGRGRKAVTSGVTKSLGAAAEGLGQLRHLGDNKLRLGPGSSPVVSPGCVRFLTGTARGYVGVLSGGVLRVHAMPRLDRKKSAGKSAASKDIEFPLPTIKDERIAPAARQTWIPEEVSGQAILPSGFWHLSKPRSSQLDENGLQVAQPLSFAEIETTSPFQPFHADRRVTLSTFTDDTDASGHGRWAFGATIPSTIVHVAGITTSGTTNDGDVQTEDILADEDGFEVLAAPSLLEDSEHRQHIA